MIVDMGQKFLCLGFMQMKKKHKKDLIMYKMYWGIMQKSLKSIWMKKLEVIIRNILVCILSKGLKL